MSMNRHKNVEAGLGVVRLKAVARYPRKLTLAEDLDFMHPNPLITMHGMVTDGACFTYLTGTKRTIKLLGESSP